MHSRWMAALVPVALLASGSAAAQHKTAPREIGKEASIPFVDHGGIYTFQPDDDGNGVYLEDNGHRWYHATFVTRCTELPYAFQVGFRTWGGIDTLDRGSTILAGHERCRIASLVTSDPPPRKAHKKES